MESERDEPALDPDDAQALDTELHGGLADDDATGPQEATSAEDVDQERSGPS